MSQYGSPNTVTGKAFLKQQREATSTAIALPIVKEAEIKSSTSSINQNHLSGKQKGAMVLVEKEDTTLHIAIAKGHLPKDGWSLVALDTTVTPAP